MLKWNTKNRGSPEVKPWQRHKFSRHQAIQLKVSTRQLMKFDQSHFYTGKSSPYIGSKIPKMLALICFQNKESLPPQPFFFTSPFFWGNKPVGCHHQVQRLSISNGIFFHLILRSCFWHLHVCHAAVSPGKNETKSRFSSQQRGREHTKKTHSCY